MLQSVSAELCVVSWCVVLCCVALCGVVWCCVCWWTYVGVSAVVLRRMFYRKRINLRITWPPTLKKHFFTFLGKMSSHFWKTECSTDRWPGPRQYPSYVASPDCDVSSGNTVHNVDGLDARKACLVSKRQHQTWPR